MKHREYRFIVWLLICTFVLPAPALSAAAGGNPHTAHILRRLNSPERQAAIAKAAEQEAAAQEAAVQETAARAESAQRQNQATVFASPVPRRERAARPQGAAPENTAALAAAATQQQSVGEVLFNYAAGFAGVPGLAPRQAVGGFPDEGLGFHQDGTARKAGGTAGFSGPSADGSRAKTYMRSGMRNALYQGQPSGLYEAMLADLWNREDSTRGGRVSAASGYSRNADLFDPLNMAVDRGLNWGAGFVNSLGEAAISGLVDGGRARLNFRMDRDGYVSGEGDALLPFYDSAGTTIYTQLGARSMHDSSDTRWIGNVGLGQRWFPFATGESLKAADYDAGNLMVGYNAFFDYDLTRDHQRGGIGAEIWYDWLRLSSNYYFPISDWKGSEDFDSRFVKERPAEGWDARAKAYLPFYRNVALTGAYAQWYGDHVGMFGSDTLEKDPRVWSYGVEYTPVPLVSGFITQKSTERGRSETEFGLNFTYHFGMPWDEQVSHAKVADLRTVGGSRHEFVDRENRIILEYKAKNNFHIEYVGMAGANTFRFRITNGFDELVSGKTVYVSTSSNITLAEAPARAAPGSLLAQAGNFLVDLFSVSTAHAATNGISKITDSRGEFTVTITSPLAQSITLIAQVGGSSASVTVDVEANDLSIDTDSLPDATQGTAYSQAIEASGGTGPYSFALSGGSLPSGMNLASGGALNGMPTESGTFTFTVRVTDSMGATADTSFTLTVNAAAAPLSITTTSPLPDAVQDMAYNTIRMAASGGVEPYAYTIASGSLPSGMNLASGGALNGMPTESGTFTFTVRVTDNAGATADTAFTLTVKAPLSITTTSSLNAATQGTAYSQTIEASGGTGPYTYDIYSGSLPSGVNLGTDGVLSGTPTESGTFSFTIRVRDSASPRATADRAFTLDVGAPEPPDGIVVQGVTGGTNPFASKTTAVFTVQVQKGGLPYLTQTSVTWSIVSADNSTNLAVTSANQSAATGLAWGSSAASSPGMALITTATSSTDGSGKATIQLTDIMGERTVTVRAAVTADGNTYTVDQTVTFGASPLSNFRLPPGGAVGQAPWANDVPLSNATTLPAADLCGTPPDASIFQNWTAGDHSRHTGLPTRRQLEMVATDTGNGAWAAAGWTNSSYWTSELKSTGYAYAVSAGNGSSFDGYITADQRVVCSR